MERRDFILGLGAVTVESLATGEGIRQAGAAGNSALQVIAGIRIVDTKIAKAADDLSQSVSPRYLYNHAMRTYLFGALMGRAAGLTFDHELLYLASILHDLGLTERFIGAKPFEIEGARAAETFLREQGLPASKAAVVWDGIAMHPLAISQYKQPEIKLVASGAAADVIGAGLDRILPADRDAVLEAFPRLGFKSGFVATCADVVRRYPASTKGTFMREIGERKVTDFHPSNICDAIEHSPFSE
jgi:HD domain